MAIIKVHLRTNKKIVQSFLKRKQMRLFYYYCLLRNSNNSNKNNSDNSIKRRWMILYVQYRNDVFNAKEADGEFAGNISV